MLKFARLFKRKALPAVVLGSALVVLSGAVLAASGYGISTREDRSSTARSASLIDDTPEVSQTLPGAEEQSAPAGSSTDTDAKKPAPAPQSSGEASGRTTCTGDMDERLRAYTKETQNEKKALDEILSFQVGSTLIEQHVENYNLKITKLHDKYTAAAKEQGCTFPVQAPDLLPLTYSLPD